MAQWPRLIPLSKGAHRTSISHLTLNHISKAITHVSSSYRSFWCYGYTRFSRLVLCHLVREPYLWKIGSTVVNALLSDGTFTPRAITRNPASDKALTLKARGAEVVQADVWDKESIKKAITGCEGVFGVCQNLYYNPSILTAFVI